MARRDMARVWRVFAVIWVVSGSACIQAAEGLENARLDLRTRQYGSAAAKLESLAKGGDPDAQYLLGLMKANGIGAAVDLPIAQRLLREAANRNKPEAAFALAGLLATSGASGRTEAFDWIEKAAKLGYQPAVEQKKSGVLPLASNRSTEGLDAGARMELARWAIRAEDLELLVAIGPRDLVLAAAPFDRSLLHVAAEQAADSAVRLLLSAGFRTDARDEFASTALMLAAQRGREGLVKHLIEAGAAVDAVDRVGRTALFRAAASNNVEAISALIRAGANANLADSQGWTALDVATQSQQSDAAAALREQGGKANLADVIAPRSAGGLDVSRPGALYKSWPALFIAVSRDDAAQLRKLLSDGANPHVASPQGDTALHVAVEAQASESLQLLLAAGADPARRNRAGETALQLAVRRSDLAALKLFSVTNKFTAEQSQALLLQAIRQGSIEAVRSLLAQGANANVSDPLAGSGVLLAVVGRHLEVLQLLLTSGAETGKADKQGRSPLWHASSTGQLQAVKSLLAARAPVNQADNDGATPLAVASGNVAVVAALLEAGADVQRRSRSGETPLFLAASLGHTDSVLALLRAGAAIDQANRFGETPLMAAVRGGSVSVCRLLLQNGANQRLRNQDRATAKDIAAARGHGDILRLIEAA